MNNVFKVSFLKLGALLNSPKYFWKMSQIFDNSVSLKLSSLNTFRKKENQS